MKNIGHGFHKNIKQHSSF